MTFLKRLWAAVKDIARRVVVFAISPAIPLIENAAGWVPTRTFGLLDIFGLIARVVFVSSFFVAPPAALMAFAIWWLKWALGFAIVGAALGFINIMSGRQEKINSWLEQFRAELDEEVAAA
jgi:hypothetical protein